MDDFRLKLPSGGWLANCDTDEMVLKRNGEEMNNMEAFNCSTSTVEVMS